MKKFLIIMILFNLIIMTIAVSANSLNTGLVEYIPQHSAIEKYIDNYTIAYSQNKYIIVDKSNNTLREYDYSIKQIDSQLFCYYNNNTGIIEDIHGAIIAQYDNSVVIKKSKKYVVITNGNGYILTDINNNIIVNHPCDMILLSNSNTALYQYNNQWHYYNIVNNAETALDIDDAELSSTENHFIISRNGLKGIMNAYGELYTNIEYDYITYANGQFIAYKNDGNDIISENGQIIYSNPVCKTSIISDDMITCYPESGIYYRNIHNNTIISVSSDIKDALPYYDNYACVALKDGSYTYLNKTGGYATDLRWDAAYRFYNGYALVMENQSENSTSNNQWYIINSNFNIIKTLDYDVYIDPYYPTSTDFSDGYIRTIDRDTGLMGFITLSNIDPTLLVKGITISGTITSYNPSNITTIQLKQGTSIIKTITINSSDNSATQAFSIPNVPDGTYDLVINKACHLRYTIKDIVVNGSNIDLSTKNAIKMIAGDIDGDGIIGIADLGIVQNNYGKKPNSDPTNPYLNKSDITGDGIIGITDIAIVQEKANFWKKNSDIPNYDDGLTYYIP